MKILYGVQGTGNGHITRAIAMTQALAHIEHVKIDVVISGRAPEELPIEANTFTWRRGLTFSTREGRIKLGSTLINNNFPKIIMDICALDIHGYDVILTDYEPVVSWAAKLHRQKTIGIGHQYAFDYSVPTRGADWLNRRVMRHFAPAHIGVGLHWHHFDQPILPPIVDLEPGDGDLVKISNKVMVYLPFEEPEQIISLLQKCPDYQFYVYHPQLSDADHGHIHRRRASRLTFKSDLCSSSAVICNSGFELISECLTLGIKILTKPLMGQVEQLSNGAALKELGYATVTDNLFLPSIERWLKSRRSVQISYPSVQNFLAQWIVGGATSP